VQKYLHVLKRWNEVPTAEQEKIKVLIPTQRKNDVIIMDNLSSHKSKAIGAASSSCPNTPPI
jgi:hypothetical protein